MTSPRVVIVSMFKNESWILKEWIDHHLDVGVCHLYLIDNGSTDDSWAVLLPYIDRGVVSCVRDAERPAAGKVFPGTVMTYSQASDSAPSETHCSGTQIQTVLYNRHWLTEVKDNADWVAVVDCDEYLYSPGRTLPQLLSDVPDEVAALWAPWRMFGSNGLVEQPESVRRSFTRRETLLEYKTRVGEKRVAGFGKSITRTTAMRQLGNHESLTFSPTVMLADRRTLRKGRPAYRVWLDSYDPAADILCCNHYSTMSRDYFVRVKMTRPGGSGSPRVGRQGEKYWAKNDKNTVEDTAILQVLGEGRS